MSDKLVYTQKRPLAIHDIFKGSQVVPVASETVSFFVLSTGVASSGEAAGTVVLGQLSKAPITNKLGDRIGANDATLFDTSVTFSDGVMVAAQEKTFVMDGLADDRITKTVERLTTNGDWALDYESGLLLIKKATTADSIAVSYKARMSVASSAGDVANDAPDSGNPVKIGAQAVDPASLPADVAIGDRVNLIASRKGELLVYNSRLAAGEDQTNNVMKTEQQFAFTRCAADTQVKASAGFIHSITIQSTDATPTAGSIIIYDNTAESGTEVMRFDVKATANVGVQSAQTVVLDCIVGTGIYVGFTTVADVAVTVSWR